MKNIILLAAILLGASVNAANFGKFKLTVNPGYYDGEEVVFLLNSAGKIKVLENDSYYDIDSDYFFGDVTVNFRSGGDEDHVEGSISLQNNKAVDGCAALVDVKNGWLTILGMQSFELERWNKFSKKYESVFTNGFQFTEECEQGIIDNYPDFEQ
jgi:hypothetical protein